ncbi:MAG: cytidylate kinase-like family protein [Acetatifactor sp.]|nr:cytidylate kinase-like family protein [Acetatifactor sp.]
MERYIITIGREFGSCGAEIGKGLAERLGIRYYDKKVIYMVADEMSVLPSDISANDEKYSKGNRYIRRTDSKIKARSDEITNYQATVIRRLATQSNCLFVGRCADYYLQDRSDVINIFIYAPFEKRCDTVGNRLLKSGQIPFDYNSIEEYRLKIQEYVAATDRERHDYYKFVTGHNRLDRSNHQIMLDSSCYGVQGAIDILELAVKTALKNSKAFDKGVSAYGR